jgi:S-adenosylmethionine/arginine decarboxylase-like enzyme
MSHAERRPTVTEEELAEMRDLHRKVHGHIVYRCYACADPWPCDTIRLLDEVERLRSAMREALGEMGAPELILREALEANRD